MSWNFLASSQKVLTIPPGWRHPLPASQFGTFTEQLRVGVSWRHAPSLGSRRSRAHHRMLPRELCARELGLRAKIVPSPLRVDGLRASSDDTLEPGQARSGLAPLTPLSERPLLPLPYAQHAHDHGDHPTNGDQRRSARRAMAPRLGHRNHTGPDRAPRPQSPGRLSRVAGERQARESGSGRVAQCS